jgi:hypothetical protein
LYINVPFQIIKGGIMEESNTIPQGRFRFPFTEPDLVDSRLDTLVVFIGRQTMSSLPAWSTATANREINILATALKTVFSAVAKIVITQFITDAMRYVVKEGETTLTTTQSE